MNGLRTTPNVVNIPAHVPFADALARGILDQCDRQPERLAQVRVLLPTRRACRALREAFLRLSDGAPMLLPVMVPLGDVDEDDLLLEGGGEFADALDLPPAVSGTRRVALLARLIRAKDAETTPDQAVRLAGELARLIDQVHTEGLDLARLPDLVTRADLSEHWQQTVDFLEILGTVWPAVLDEHTLMDPAKRRDALLRARAQHWREQPPQTPIIAAGSTGTIPATAELLAVVAHLPQGALVLPGLDANAPDEVWGHLDATHPQYGMAQLLAKLGVARTDVQLWPGCEADSPRATALAQALVPAEATHLWRERTARPEDFAGVQMIDAPTPREEATAIALILRKTLEVPERTAALITPDRSLARRVATELGRWGVEVDDSAGIPLDQTPPGAFFHLVATMAAEGFAPVDLLACLKHPLAAGGMNPAKLRAGVRALELALLRGPRPASGLQGLEDQLRVFLHDKDAQKRFERHGLDQSAVRAVLEMLRNIVQPLCAALVQQNVEPQEVMQLHARAAEQLAQSDDGEARRLWAGEAGEALSGFIAEAHEALGALGPVRGDQYPALIQALMAGRPVRPRYAAHPRLNIWGPLEARLQHADVVVLGGLNEGTWPPQTEASPWMSRPMMKDFGLPLPERRVGLSAHDFTQAACAAPEVYLTRAGRDEGSPQVPSRWLVRLETMLGDDAKALTAQEPWLAWAAQLSMPTETAQPLSAPRPTPPVEARPTQMSVTQVETWIRDPYSIYAKRILRLSPLDDLEAEPGAADRGIVIHEALERFIKQNRDSLPDAAREALLEIGRNVFDEFVPSPSVRAFWWPRFVRIADWFVKFETKRRAAGLKPVVIETRGEMDIDGFTQPFRLTCQADRIDADPLGALHILDYKTGQPPSTKQVDAGLTPQLPLEAAIAKAGGFEEIPSNADIAELLYLRLSGGRVAGEDKPIKLDAEEATQNAYEGLVKLVHQFEDQDTPYLSRPRPMFESRFGDFDHLARVKEWSGGDSGGDA